MNFFETIFSTLFDIRGFFGSIWEEYGLYVQFFSLLISLVLFGCALYLVTKTNFITSRVDRWVGTLSTEKLHKRRSLRAWVQIQRRLKSGNEADSKLALIEADKVLDEVIKMIGYRGDTMADRLKQISPAQLSNINDIWDVHKLRNRLVHDVDFKVAHYEIERAINVYKKSFKEMGLLD
ncbi:MAG: hypothetical protein A3A04_01975 [Candidatus Harrisonbacteria bacterium RIFCSPLOWO2_01_FULL_40_28]|uniref:DUF4145 domain-containing protein n=2 Tax=Candidatus Harrisoniibacteriota TaxID=1817905 RepID=A0A1G1ZWY4_9BACT|nr:MAG: hypothetical protein A3A04_01975 [Candidatus Harrisonbacteria bacterium RIFCSPLOWO2_01_FULL_40_28]OGY69158.1 MAG: hypothetical protein A2586_00075 [Candidatus Harrisonbacteria bacterium RIFOXYD1_FULL_40_9]